VVVQEILFDVFVSKALSIPTAETRYKSLGTPTRRVVIDFLSSSDAVYNFS